MFAAFLAKPCLHLVKAVYRDRGWENATPRGFIDDASRLNQTRSDTWDIPVDQKNWEIQLAQLLARARQEGRRVSIAGARHSMGGHSIYPGGISINMLPLKAMDFDEARKILHVQAGALWRDIIPYLDKRGYSVEVMQSNDSFSVGGSISVNCHGWQYNRPPIASTVESFRLMLADGTIRRCSRSENKELFSLALGGFGLFGIILDVELRVVRNERYRMVQYVVPVGQSITTFQEKIANEPNLQMFYARMNVDPIRLFDNVILDAFIREDGKIPDLTAQGLIELRRAIFRGSAIDDYGKKLRYSAETNLQPFLIGKVFSRNQLLNEGVEIFENRTVDTTDILQEYFVPHAQAASFVDEMRDVIRRRRPNLLNVTVRLVNEDKDTVLRYADQAMVAFVMLFVQQKTAEGEERMKSVAQDLIAAAIKNKGRYYLPYRLHATRQQFYRAYPKARRFFELKRKYDPSDLLQNNFYAEYGQN